MTSRTSPVGILVVALAGLIAVGCSAPTNAVFQALLDPAATPESTPGAGSLVEPAAEVEPTATWWPHPDGYAMDLPAGWIGVALEAEQTAQLVEAVADTMPELATRMYAVLDGTTIRVSAVAVDPTTDGLLAPVLIVLAQPTEGRRAREVKAHVHDQIARLPGASEPVAPHDVVLNTAKGVRFDYSIADPDLGELRVRSYLFRFGRQAYLVNFIASAAISDDIDAIFDEIANSLRFGV